MQKPANEVGKELGGNAKDIHIQNLSQLPNDNWAGKWVNVETSEQVAAQGIIQLLGGMELTQAYEALEIAKAWLPRNSCVLLGSNSTSVRQTLMRSSAN